MTAAFTNKQLLSMKVWKATPCRRFSNLCKNGPTYTTEGIATRYTESLGIKHQLNRLIRQSFHLDDYLQGKRLELVRP